MDENGGVEKLGDVGIGCVVGWCWVRVIKEATGVGLYGVGEGGGVL